MVFERLKTKGDVKKRFMGRTTEKRKSFPTSHIGPKSFLIPQIFNTSLFSGATEWEGKKGLTNIIKKKNLRFASYSKNALELL